MPKKIKCPNPDCNCTIELTVDEKKNLTANLLEAEKPAEPIKKEPPVKSENDIIDDLVSGFDDDADDSIKDDDDDSSVE